MVRRVLSLVYKEVQGLHQAAYVLALFAFSSQLLALVRDRLLAHQFGAGVELDLYYAAFRIPDLLYVLFASVLSVYVLIPFVSKREEEQGTLQANVLLSQVFSVFLVCYSIIALIIFLCAPLLVPYIFPGFGVAEQGQLVMLLRILLLQPLFLGISSLYGVITQLSHRFVLYAISPLLYNLGIILGIVVFYHWFGMAGLAVGVVVGAVGHLLVQVPLAAQSPLRFTFVRSIRRADILPVFAVSVPRALTLSINQVVLLGLMGMASVMATGSVAVFQLAYNLHSVPLAIIGVSYSVAAFPMLAQLAASREMEAFRNQILTALRHILFWSLPAIALCIVLRAQLVRVVFGSGEFDWSDTRLTAAVFAILIISLAAQAFLLLLVRASYAAGNTRTPLMVSACGAVLALGGSYGLYVLYQQGHWITDALNQLFRVSDIAGTEILAIALGYMVALVVQVGVLMWCLQGVLMLPYTKLLRGAGEALLAAIVGGVSAYSALNFFVDGINNDTFIGILIQGALAGGMGLAGVVLSYYAVGSKEFFEIIASFRRRIFKTDIIAPQEDIL